MDTALLRASRSILVLVRVYVIFPLPVLRVGIGRPLLLARRSGRHASSHPRLREGELDMHHIGTDGHEFHILVKNRIMLVDVKRRAAQLIVLHADADYCSLAQQAHAGRNFSYRQSLIFVNLLRNRATCSKQSRPGMVRRSTLN
jgi:hypothetical protein